MKKRWRSLKPGQPEYSVLLSMPKNQKHVVAEQRVVIEDFLQYTGGL